MHRIIKAEFEAFSKDVLAGKWDSLDRVSQQVQTRFELFPKPTSWFKSFPLITYLLHNGTEIDIARGVGSEERTVRRFNFFNKDNPVPKAFADIVFDFFNIDKCVVYALLGVENNQQTLEAGFSLFRIKYDQVAKTITSRITSGGKTAVVTNKLPPLLTTKNGQLRTNYFVTVDNPLAICLTAVALVNRSRDTASIQLNKDGLFDDSGFIVAYKGFAVRLGILLAGLVTKTNVNAGMGFSAEPDTIYQPHEIHKTTCALLPQTNYHYQIFKSGSMIMRRASPTSGAADGRLLSFADGQYSFHGKLIDEIWRMSDRCRIKSRIDSGIDLTQNYRAINQGMFIPVKTLEEAQALDIIFFSNNVVSDSKTAFADEYERINRTRGGGYIAVVSNKCTHIGNNILRTTVINLLTGKPFLVMTEDVTDMVEVYTKAGGIVLPNHLGYLDYFIEARYAKVLGILLTTMDKVRIASSKNATLRGESIKIRTEVYGYLRICGVNVDTLTYNYDAVGVITASLNNKPKE